MNIRKGIVQYCLLFLFCISGSAALSSPYETIDHLNTIATEFIQKNVELMPDEKIEMHLGQAAYDLHLSSCNTPISVSLPAESGGQKINTLEMTCSSQPSWHVYVPIDMKVLTKVIVAKENIPSKTVISEDMLDYAYHDKSQMYSGFFKEMKDVVSLVPTSNLVAGTVISKRNIQFPVIISRNQLVTIVAKSGNIMVTAQGIAKTDGALNDIIKVMNSSSKKTIDAVVTSGTTVEVGA